MKNPKGGRPADYAKEQLLEILLQYTKEHPDQTIRLFELEAATGIKRHVWTYNMKEEIDKINREVKKVDVARTGISLPSAEQILASCKGDEEKLAMQIQTLIEMVQDEIRERFHFFRIMGNILFYLGKESAEVLQYMNDRNKRLYVPISERCLLRIFTFCKEDYEKYLSDPELGIKYTNQRIVELLQIRKLEQWEMKQLIGETEAWERNKVSHIISTRKAYAPIKHDKRYAREMKEEVDKEEFLRMRQLGMSNNQIAKKKNVDTRKVDRLIGKNTEKETERELLKQRVIDMTVNGKSASKISKELGVSVSTVRRIRAKAQQ